MRADIRLLTAITMIGICGISVVRGWNIVHFSLAMANIDSTKKRAEIIDSWAAAPGLALSALRFELTDESNPSTPNAANRRRGTLSAILSIEPMSSMEWLSLARVQLATNQPINQVVGSFRLSVLTGPNEASVMVERAIFGISIWDSLPQDLKSHVAVDLGPVIFPLSPIDGGKIRAAISGETDKVRNELRQALVTTGVSRQTIEQRLGF
jgi:hypothetical protein